MFSRYCVSMIIIFIFNLALEDKKLENYDELHMKLDWWTETKKNPSTSALPLDESWTNSTRKMY